MTEEEKNTDSLRYSYQTAVRKRKYMAFEGNKETTIFMRILSPVERFPATQACDTPRGAINSEFTNWTLRKMPEG